MRALILLALACVMIGCSSSGDGKDRPALRTVGSVERLDGRLDKLVPKDAAIEVLDEGFDWSEGPVWFADGKHLLFSDVPRNVIYKWSEGRKSQEFIKPSGYTGATPRGGEPGSNGLTRDARGRLVACEHGDRRVTRLEPDGTKTVLADRFEGKRFNSPNDCILDRAGNLYFTDPPYGLVRNVDDPAKELPFQGVFRVSPDGAVRLLTKEMTRPNGIALSPDEKTLYVANSDPDRPVIMAFPLSASGELGAGRVLFDASALLKAGRKGLPDGLKVDRAGNLFATGPGGVLVIAPDGTHLGTLLTGQATSNCAWGDADGRTLYITADLLVCRVRLKTRGDLPGVRK